MEYTLFTYGTLRMGEPNNEILKYHSEFIETCTTLEKYIMLSQKSKSYPFLVPVNFWKEKEEFSTYISGDVFKVDKIGLLRCDKLEGHPDWYRRTPIQVQNKNGEILEVETYLLTEYEFGLLDKDCVLILSGDWKIDKKK